MESASKFKHRHPNNQSLTIPVFSAHYPQRHQTQQHPYQLANKTSKTHRFRHFHKTQHRKKTQFNNHNSVAGTLAYMSPEQTGRMMRSTVLTNPIRAALMLKLQLDRIRSPLSLMSLRIATAWSLKSKITVKGCHRRSSRKYLIIYLLPKK